MAFIKTVYVNTTQETDFIPIIHDVRFAVRDGPAADGLVTVSLPGAEALLFVSPLPQERLLEMKEKFRGMEGLQTSVSIPFQKKEILLEPKQMIWLVDFSTSGRRREVHIQVLGDSPPAAQGPGQAQGGKRR